MDSKDIGYLIKSIDEKLKAKADSDLKDHGLTFSQSLVLTFLYEKENHQATQKEIENRLNVSHPAVTGIVSRMEQNDHVITWMDPDNRRNKIVKLTPKALALGESMNGLRLHWESVMLQGFSPEETEQLKKALQLVIHNLT